MSRGQAGADGGEPEEAAGAGAEAVTAAPDAGAGAADTAAPVSYTHL
ncbi:hypothetical protein [Streptomyces sp. b94]|nr:hypothetical protein [Streptomyces sp. b94]